MVLTFFLAHFSELVFAVRLCCKLEVFLQRVLGLCTPKFLKHCAALLTDLPELCNRDVAQ